MVSRKLSKPSLKNYLSTGKVITEEPEKVCEISETADGEQSAAGQRIDADADKLLGLFSQEDVNTWEPVFKAGAEIKKETPDLAALREFFRTMDRAEFTLYILENKGSVMRIIRSGVQIREPFLLFLLWDDIGTASLYISDESLIS